MLKLEFVLLALVALFGLGLVPALTQLVREANEGLVRWIGTIATVGYAVTAASYFFALGRLPKVAAAYVAGDESTKAALLATWRSSLDLQGYWQFLAVRFLYRPRQPARPSARAAYLTSCATSAW